MVKSKNPHTTPPVSLLRATTVVSTQLFFCLPTFLLLYELTGFLGLSVLDITTFLL